MTKKQMTIEALKTLLSEEQQKDCLAHFNEIYECNQLGESEWHLILLVWALESGAIFINGDFWEIEGTLVDIDEDYYQGIHIDDDTNYATEYVYDYYALDELSYLFG